MPIATLDIPTLDTVVFSQTKRAKRISISVAPFKPVRVAFPRRVSFKKAHKYLLENIGWVQKTLNDVRKVEQEHRTTVSNEPKMPRAKAKEILKNRLLELAEEHGFKYNKVFIKSQKTRWGSCSEHNNINLNINLAGLTDELRDYVLLHELLHTKIKNHSKKYWAELDRHVGGSAKDLDKQLMKHRLGLRQ